MEETKSNFIPFTEKKGVFTDSILLKIDAYPTFGSQFIWKLKKIKNYKYGLLKQRKILEQTVLF
jgi:hypothetical protein